MEIRLIFFKEIVGLISLKKGSVYPYAKHFRSREEKSRRRFFLPKVSLLSILQKSTHHLRFDSPYPIATAANPRIKCSPTYSRAAGASLSRSNAIVS